ncbi:hypothetical protein [Thermoactinospora rubra]|uniref:hypothetical protein n=1 Tax=Thermoactinospora rubra TaxID=1088767 RepID=UPI000A115CBF|nr:hypothetical protein [Thermoactinospora rubra]
MHTFDDIVLPLLPPIHLPPDSRLAAAVRATPLAADFLNLRGPRELAAQAGLAAADGGAGPELEVLRSGSDEEVLRLWSEVCFLAVHPDELGSRDSAVWLVELFLAGEPLRGRAETLEPLGLVEQRGERVTLTPLGRWAARHLIAGLFGQDVPVFGSLAGRDAAALLHALRSYPEDERRQELAGWLEGRDPAKAAQEIAGALAEATPLARTVGIQLLHSELGPEGRGALRGLLSAPRIGALVAARLGEDRGSSAEEIAWVLVDMAASILEYGGDSEQVAEAMSLGMDPGELAETIPIVAFGGHPETERVLLALLDRHTDPRILSAARKALRRFRGLSER